MKQPVDGLPTGDERHFAEPTSNPMRSYDGLMGDGLHSYAAPDPVNVAGPC